MVRILCYSATILTPSGLRTDIYDEGHYSKAFESLSGFAARELDDHRLLLTSSDIHSGILGLRLSGKFQAEGQNRIPLEKFYQSIEALLRREAGDYERNPGKQRIMATLADFQARRGKEVLEREQQMVEESGVKEREELWYRFFRYINSPPGVLQEQA